jgi:hypothetical protein
MATHTQMSDTMQADGLATTDDRSATALARTGASKMPVPEMLVWVCAFAGLGAYLGGVYFPQLGRFVQP